MKLRHISDSVIAHSQKEGDGFIVRRPFPSSISDQAVDPFLLIDEFGPIDYAPGEALGTPEHPHRGFEAVSYMLEGTFFKGNFSENPGLSAKISKTFPITFAFTFIFAAFSSLPISSCSFAS